MPAPKAEAQAKQKRPNLVFFLGEGQRADALSIAGHPILKTPNHDRIGREGVRFANAISQPIVRSRGSMKIGATSLSAS